MLKQIERSLQTDMTIEEMEHKYPGFTILLIITPNDTYKNTGIPVAISDSSDIQELKKIEKQYKADGYDMAIAVSDYDNSTLTVTEFEVL